MGGGHEPYRDVGNAAERMDACEPLMSARRLLPPQGVGRHVTRSEQPPPRQQDFPLEGQGVTLPGAGTGCLRPLPQLERTLPRPPNYKQEKKRREEQQKKKNDAKQRELAERKKPPADPQPP